MEYYIYKTANSLILDTRETRQISSSVPKMVGEKITVDKLPSKDHTRTSLKLSVFKGKLRVTCRTSTDNRGTYRSRSSLTEMFHPSLGGILVRYIPLDMVDLIKEFLDQHFPETKDTEYDSLTPVYDIEDLPTFDKNLSEKDLARVCGLALRIIRLAFPISSNFIKYSLSDGFYSMSTKSDLLYPYHYATTSREFLVSLFGYYRKDLAKAIMKHNIDAIEWVSHFSEFVPSEFLIDTLNSVGENETHADVSANLDFHLLQRFSQKTIKNLILDGLTNVGVDSFQVSDALEMSINIPPEENKNIQSWQELHDLGIGNFRLKVSDEATDIEFTQTFTDLFSDIGVDYSIQPLQHAKDFVFVGQSMKLCVGSISYVNRAYNGDGVYFLMSKKDEKDLVKSENSVLVEIMKQKTNGYNIRENQVVDFWHVAQVYGYDNSSKNSNYYKSIVIDKAKKRFPKNMVLTNR